MSDLIVITVSNPIAFRATTLCAAGNGEPRTCLRGIYIEPENNLVVATNGNRMLVTKSINVQAWEDAPEPFIMVFDKKLPVPKAKDMGTFPFEIDVTGSTLYWGSVSIKFLKSKLQFPKWRNVLPKKNPTKDEDPTSPAFNPNLLFDVTQAFGANSMQLVKCGHGVSGTSMYEIVLRCYTAPGEDASLKEGRFKDAISTIEHFYVMPFLSYSISR